MKLGYHAKIYTVDGWQKIGKIKKGTLILNSNKKFEPVIDIKRKSYTNKKMYELIYSNMDAFDNYNGADVKFIFDDSLLFHYSDGWDSPENIECATILATRCNACDKLIPYSYWCNLNGKESESCSGKCNTLLLHEKYGIEYLTKRCHEVTKERSENGTHQWQKRNRTWIPWYEKPLSETVETRKKLSDNIKKNHPMSTKAARLKNANSQKKVWNRPGYRKRMSQKRKDYIRINGNPSYYLKNWRDNNPNEFKEAQRKAQLWKKDKKKFDEAQRKAQLWKKDNAKFSKAMENLSKSVKKFHADNPGYTKCLQEKWRRENPNKWEKLRKRFSKNMKKRWNDSSYDNPMHKFIQNGRISKPQKEVYKTIKSKYPDAKLNHKIRTKVSWRFGDVVLIDKKIIVEYDGKYWHQDKEKDLQRDKELNEVGYSVIHVNEDDWETVLDKIDRLLKNHNGQYEFIQVKIKSIKPIIYKKIVLYNLITESNSGFIAKGFVVK